MKHGLCIAITLLAMTLVSPGCSSRTPLRVAVYSDAGAMEPYITAAETTVRSENVPCERILAEDVRGGDLDDFDVVIFPGGSGNGLAESLGEDGGAAVTEFVRDGGGVIGLCAGGYLCAIGYNEKTSRVELINARVWDLDNWARGEGIAEVKLDESEEPVRLHFENAPVFEPGIRDDLPPYVSLGRFVSDPAGEPPGRDSIAGRDAIVASSFGEGRVVLFGPHPELTSGQGHLLPNAVQWAAGRSEKPLQ